MRSKLPSLVLIVLLVGGGVWYFSRDTRTPKERAEELYEKGHQLTADGKYDDAIGPLSKAVELDPNHAQAHAVLGDCLYQKGDFRAARRHYAKTLELIPYAADVLVAHAGCLLKTMENKDEAWKLVNRELRKLTPQGLRKPSVAYNLACLYAENDRPALALRYLSYAIEKAPSLREIAKHDKCLDSIRHTDQFRRLVE